MTYEHILVVDDDKKIRFLIAKFLREHNFIVSTAENVNQCEDCLKTFIFNLIILDTLMPGESGIDFLRRIRNQLKGPVIMLTALGEVDDRINGLESGADDYLSKPFEPRELLLRIQKILKRNSATSQNKMCNFGEYIFNLENGTLCQNGEYIHLTNNEIKILKILASSPGQIITREEIMQNFPEINIRTIDVLVARTRAKLKKSTKTPQYLQTIRNKGYVLWGKKGG